MSDEARIVEVMQRAIEWFDFDASEDVNLALEAESLSLARVVLANLQAKGFEVVLRGMSSADVCVIHLAIRAIGEDPSVCWKYDGIEDCRFTKPFDPVVDCPECGDDSHLVFPSAQPGAPDFGEYECLSCRRNFIRVPVDVGEDR